jgi:GNAT superfamily N-acetyltransferase
LAAYRSAGDECELVLLEALEQGRGVGTALFEAIAEVARRLNSRRLWLVTTNDNVDALRF